MKQIKKIPATYICPLCREPVSDVTSHIKHRKCAQAKACFVADLPFGGNYDPSVLFQDQDGDLWIMEVEAEYDYDTYNFKPAVKDHIESWAKQYDVKIEDARIEITRMTKNMNKLVRLLPKK